MEMETIAGLISIWLYLCKLSSRHLLQILIFSPNYVIKSLLERRHTSNSQPYHLSLENITFKQQKKIKSFIINTNNHLNGVFLSFDSLNSKFLPELRLINIFLVIYLFTKLIATLMRVKQPTVTGSMNSF